jgi:hypothetical protein
MREASGRGGEGDLLLWLRGFLGGGFYLDFGERGIYEGESKEEANKGKDEDVVRPAPGNIAGLREAVLRPVI